MSTKTGAVKVYTLKDGKSARVGLTSSLTPQCSIDGGADWCEHIEHLVKNNDDAELWWKATADTENANREIAVPIFPTKNIWARVVLGPGNPTVRAYPVYYRPTRDTASFGPGGMDSDVFLGFFSEGEGLTVLRGMVWNHYTGHAHTIGECESKRHSFKEQMRWERIKKAGVPSDWQAELFMVMDTGECMACNMGALDDDFADVVPEGTGKKNW